MTTLTFGGTRSASRYSIGHAVTGLVARLGREVSLWRATRAMEGLDDHMLHDIGVVRGEVETAVRSGRAGLGA